MPPKRSQSSRNLVEQEGRILLAISAIQKTESLSVRQAARSFNVPESTLRSRLHGVTHRLDIRANSYKLTPTEEETLLQWILSMDRRGAPPRHAAVRDMANILLQQRGSTPPQTVGKNWVSNYVKRHSEIKTRFSRRYDHQRALCEDPKIIQAWFDCVQRSTIQYGILPDDIYNFDETGFAMGLIATARVVTRADTDSRGKLLQPGNREWVTTIESINTLGWALPPCIIFKGKNHIQGWYEDLALPNDWRIELSDNGWTTDEISLSWLQKVFIPSTNSRVKGKYRLLILDGHGSHLTPQFDQICSQNDIIPICMPPHSSHLLQPLDVGCFAPLKRAYGRLVENHMRDGINHIDKLDFLAAYPQARMEAFKASSIQNSFAAAGLVPYNPERVLNQLNIQLKTPTPPGSRSSEWEPQTPHNLVQLAKQASTIKALLKRRSKSPQSPTNVVLDQLIKGCEITMNTAVIMKKELSDLRAANEKQKQKRTRSKRRIASGEGMSIQEGRELIAQPEQAAEARYISEDQPAPDASEPRRRAPPRCSDCRDIGHRRLQCPNRSTG
jgi:hypothetical protein